MAFTTFAVFAVADTGADAPLRATSCLCSRSADINLLLRRKGVRLFSSYLSLSECVLPMGHCWFGRHGAGPGSESHAEYRHPSFLPIVNTLQFGWLSHRAAHFAGATSWPPLLK